MWEITAYLTKMKLSPNNIKNKITPSYKTIISFIYLLYGEIFDSFALSSAIQHISGICMYLLPNYIHHVIWSNASVVIYLIDD